PARSPHSRTSITAANYTRRRFPAECTASRRRLRGSSQSAAQPARRKGPSLLFVFIGGRRRNFGGFFRSRHQIRPGSPRIFRFLQDEFHGARYRQPDKALGLIDPAVAIEAFSFGIADFNQGLLPLG